MKLAEVLIVPIAILINCCLNEGILTDSLKIAAVRFILEK